MNKMFESLYTRVLRSGNRVEIYYPIKKTNEDCEFYLFIKDDTRFTFSKQTQNIYQFEDLLRSGGLEMNIENQTRKQAFIKVIFLLKEHKK